MKNINRLNILLSFTKTFHKFHIVDPSPWPLFGSIGSFMTTTGSVLWFHKFLGGTFLLYNGLLYISYVMTVWWRDVIREATFEKHHNFVVRRGLKLGFVLFLISEIMFFFGFFWAFFHASLNPVHNIGGVWPPIGIVTPNFLGTPLTISVFLITSGATLTGGHHFVKARAKRHGVIMLLWTLLLAFCFSFLQLYEYISLSFNISDGIYGSCFYMLTGLHGFHVFAGTIGILVALIRLALNHFTNTQHLGLLTSVWYWHFVDVVWIFLYFSVYVWGSLKG